MLAVRWWPQAWATCLATPPSPGDQQPHLQVDALQRAGCYRAFTETAGGAAAARPSRPPDQTLDQLRPGDTLVVWKLDRLSRSD